MVSVSLMFFGLYIAGVIALHRGLRPLSETAGLIRDLLPERKVEPASPVTVDTGPSTDNLGYSEEAKPRPDFVAVPEGTEAKA
jgi:hypothetical protein